jgi:hypothetical protein
VCRTISGVRTQWVVQPHSSSPQREGCLRKRIQNSLPRVGNQRAADSDTSRLMAVGAIPQPRPPKQTTQPRPPPNEAGECHPHPSYGCLDPGMCHQAGKGGSQGHQQAVHSRFLGIVDKGGQTCPDREAAMPATGPKRRVPKAHRAATSVVPQTTERKRNGRSV